MSSSLQAQIAEVEREIDMRRRVYPSWIARGKMRQGEADLHISRMEDVLATLLALQREKENAA
jgi:hypothetical protein